MDYKDYYKILGVDRKAQEKDIKSAYRRLARKHHPDVNPNDKQAEARFKDIGEAYAVLSDPEKRSRYDALGPNWQQFAQAGTRPGAQGRTGGPFGETTYGFPGGTRVEYDFGNAGAGAGRGGFSDFFESLFGSDFGARPDLGRRSRRPIAAQDLEDHSTITFAEAYTGAERRFQIETHDVCPTCKGTGVKGNSTCPTCGGTGSLVKSKVIEVKIPAGVRTGSRIRVKGEGSAGSDGTRADLYVVVEVLPDPAFRREDDDLYTDVQTELSTAILGGEVRVPTPKGTHLSLKVPQETPNGRVFRLRGMGMPHLRGTGSGDLLAKVSVVLPTGLTQDEKDMVAALGKRQAARVS